MSISAAIVGFDAGNAPGFERALNRVSSIQISRRYPHYPEPEELQRFLRAMEPDLMFISSVTPRTMQQVAELVANVLPACQMILVDETGSTDTFRTAMRAGMRECLSAPFSADELQGIVERSIARRASLGGDRSGGTNALYSFFPAKAGIGASLLAWQTALAMPKDETRRTLLLDADLDAGMQQFVLRIQNPHSLVDAMERLEEMDEHFWPQLVTSRGISIFCRRAILRILA